MSAVHSDRAVHTLLSDTGDVEGYRKDAPHGYQSAARAME